MASSRTYRAKSIASTPRTTKIHSTRRSAAPRSRRRRAAVLQIAAITTAVVASAARDAAIPAVLAFPAFAASGATRQLVIVALAGILAVRREHDRDLVTPHVEL